jgi:plastocyanin
MSNWGNSGYNNCVQQCVASYGGLSGSYTPSSTSNSGSYGSSGSSSSSGSSGSSGSGATHTVIVAPTQGVLRYVPFVVNASVGDTIQFMWGANNHTVTKSSELTPCNKTSDSPFASGEQNKGFMFTQVVNDTNPTFFYCGTPTHCQKGMFGIINPPNAFASPMSVSGMMQSLAANDSNVAAYAAYTDTQTSSNPGAAKWGGNIDLTSLPEWSHSLVAENVLYTRNFIAANAETLKEDGSVDLSASGSTPLMIPQDLSAALAASASPSAAATDAPAAATPAAATPSPASSGAANAENLKSGALSVSSSKVAVGLVAAFATFLML